MKAARRFINKEPTVVKVLADENGHKVIFQPPYHTEISPIETVWAQTKYNVAVQYCERVRQKQWEQDNMLLLVEDNYTGDGTSDLENDDGECVSDVSEGSDAETERENMEPSSIVSPI